ncbi:MAG: hypothetical protein PHX04_01220 [Bacilli bacterium]|nr:hypothetical protein [Bacilli bacterium]
MKNRYNFFKKKFKHYIILIKKKDIYYTFDQDKEILKYIEYKKINDVRKKQINYIIIDNLEIELKKEYPNNNYELYLLKIFIKQILSKIEGKLK